MADSSIRKRKFYTFLSHAHVDKEVVNRLHRWMTEAAGIPVWYDATQLPPSAMIGTVLPDAVLQCRGMIIALSKSSLQSGWVQEEYNAAILQRAAFRDYRIIPIRLDDSPVPHFLQTTKWIDLTDGVINTRTADELLSALYAEHRYLEPASVRDVYISRTWRDGDALLADHVCSHLDKQGFRLIGDSRDQAGFGEGERIKSIVSSCGALAAILPDRGEGKTSDYMLKEIALAQEAGLPCLVVAEPSVRLPPHLEGEAVRMTADAAPRADTAPPALRDGIDRLEEEWRQRGQPHYVFFSTKFGETYTARNRIVQQLIQRVTAMHCVMGDDIREGRIQQVITDLLRRAFMIVTDISEENLNTCIEAGIALGAQRRLHLIAGAPRRRPPFMFRDQQVWHYADDGDLVGLIHRIVYLPAAGAQCRIPWHRVRLMSRRTRPARRRSLGEGYECHPHLHQ